MLSALQTVSWAWLRAVSRFGHLSGPFANARDFQIVLYTDIQTRNRRRFAWSRTRRVLRAPRRGEPVQEARSLARNAPDRRGRIVTAALIAQLRDRLAKARNAIDQLDSDLVKAGHTPPDDSGVHVAIAQHHLESVAALLRASEARGMAP